MAGFSFHQNGFRPAPDIVIRDAHGQPLWNGPVALDDSVAGSPHGVMSVPGEDNMGLEMLLTKAADGTIGVLFLPYKATGLNPDGTPTTQSLTPFFEMFMAAYFVVAVHIAVANGHYVSVPFLLLFLFDFGYVGTVSAWQGSLGQSVRRLWQRAERAPSLSMVAAPLVAAMPDCTPGPVLLTSDRSARPVRSRAAGEHQDTAAV